MTAERRLAALTQALPAKEATLLWMDDAFAYGSLPEYTRAIIDEPDDVAPFLRVAKQAQAAAREATKGKPREEVDRAVDRATREALLLVAIVLQLNVTAYERDQIESLRTSAMAFHLRALFLDQELAELDPARSATSRPEFPSTWHSTTTLCRRQVEVIAVEDAAYQEFERRYFDGQPALFPELGERWDATIELTERVGQLANDLALLCPDVEVREVLDLPAVPSVDERVAGIVDRARATAYDLLGERQRALAAMGRVMGSRG